MNDYHKIPLNLDKRHFIVGDIHGMFEQLNNLLDSVNYDPETDIIYSVGDMIDRGAFSYEVLTFFTQNNTYALRGNHEHMAIHKAWYTVWLRNGGVDCLHSIRDNNYDLEWLIKTIKKFPYVLDVGSEGEEHAFRLVHAEIPPGWSEDDFQTWMRRQHDHHDDYEHILWSRATITAALRNQDNGKPLETNIPFNENRSGRNVFVGHTPIKEAVTVGDMTYLDTYWGGTLSMINAITKEVHSVPVPRGRK